MSVAVEFVLLFSDIDALFLWNEQLVTIEYENTIAKLLRTYEYLCLDVSKNLKHPNFNKSAHEGGKFVSPTNRSNLLLGNISVINFC